MRILTILLLLACIIYVSDAWFGSSRSSSSSSSRSRSRLSRSRSRSRYTSRSRNTNRYTSRRNSYRRTPVKKGPSFNLRNRDSTGHRTGLGTITKSFIRNPVKTIKSFGAFKKNYNKMVKANVKGGNLKAHEKANYEATKIGGSKLAGAISALREQYKRFRVKTNPDGVRHIGDTRTAKEIKDTMDANRRGRERATKG